MFPIVNIDGYLAYINGGNMDLRKNLNAGDIKCPKNSSGVDINRNFPSSFGTLRTSNSPCSEEYHGTAPFSEE